MCDGVLEEDTDFEITEMEEDPIFFNKGDILQSLKVRGHPIDVDRGLAKICYQKGSRESTRVSHQDLPKPKTLSLHFKSVDHVTTPSYLNYRERFKSNMSRRLAKFLNQASNVKYGINDD